MTFCVLTSWSPFFKKDAKFCTSFRCVVSVVFARTYCCQVSFTQQQQLKVDSTRYVFDATLWSSRYYAKKSLWAVIHILSSLDKILSGFLGSSYSFVDVRLRRGITGRVYSEHWIQQQLQFSCGSSACSPCWFVVQVASPLTRIVLLYWLALCEPRFVFLGGWYSMPGTLCGNWTFMSVGSDKVKMCTNMYVQWIIPGTFWRCLPYHRDSPGDIFVVHRKRVPGRRVNAHQTQGELMEIYSVRVYL